MQIIFGHIPRGKGYSDYEKLSHKRIAFSLWHLLLSSLIFEIKII